MTTPPAPEIPEAPPPENDERLFGSKAADIVAGIVAAFLWWGLAWGVLAASRGASGVGFGVVVLAFLAQTIAVGMMARNAAAFILTEVLAALLLPLLALGLLWGACMLGGGGFH
jgi:hypothetical protein